MLVEDGSRQVYSEKKGKVVRNGSIWVLNGGSEGQSVISGYLSTGYPVTTENTYPGNISHMGIDTEFIIFRLGRPGGQ